MPPDLYSPDRANQLTGSSEAVPALTAAIDQAAPSQAAQPLTAAIQQAAPAQQQVQTHAPKPKKTISAQPVFFNTIQNRAAAHRTAADHNNRILRSAGWLRPQPATQPAPAAPVTVQTTDNNAAWLGTHSGRQG